MTKYHVSNETGEPGVCTAQPGQCPVNRAAGDDETPHYATEKEARAGFEKLNDGKEFTSVSKDAKSPEEALLQKKMQEVSSDPSYSNEQAKFELNSLSRELTIVRNKEAFDRNMIPSVIKFHNDKNARMLEVRAMNNNSRGMLDEMHPCRNIGQINPSTLDSGGTGAKYVPKGECSMTILAKPDGSGVRAIASHGENYDNPERMLGINAIQIKQGAKDVERRGLIVAGYISASGERFGYVPDRGNISAFVYK